MIKNIQTGCVVPKLEHMAVTSKYKQARPAPSRWNGGTSDNNTAATVCDQDFREWWISAANLDRSSTLFSRGRMRIFPGKAKYSDMSQIGTFDPCESVSEPNRKIYPSVVAALGRRR